MDSRQIVKNTIHFTNSGRMPFDFPEPFGTDFYWTGLHPSPDDRPRQGGIDEWGAVWQTFGFTSLGEVKDFPLKDWKDFDRLEIPDIHDPIRWQGMDEVRSKAGDKFILASGLSIYERVHFIRGLENTWTDIYEHPEELAQLIDILTEMNLAAIEHYAHIGADGLIFCDDWGLQNRLMISPKAWRAIWKPRYARIYQAAHEAGLLTFLHSCGYIIEILDDLIEIGLDVIHMDQQENMGLENLGQRFAGRLTFFAPVDIQMTMARGDLDEIRAYARKITRLLGRPGGGFIPRWYSDPKGAGHTDAAVEAMCEEFLRLNAEFAESS